MDEYNTVVDGALDMRRKFSIVVSLARQLEAELQEKEAALRKKEAEIDRLTAFQQNELLNHQRSAEIIRKKLRRQGRCLQQSREANKDLRRRNEEKARDLQIARKVLD